MLKPSFIDDIYIKKIIPVLDQYDVISFDLFDTLLLRAVYKPENIFMLLGKAIKETYTDYNSLSVEALCELRIEADRQARKKVTQLGLEDVLLEQIYEQISLFGNDRHDIMNIEISIEKDHVFPNFNIYGFAKYCHSIGKKIVILSDFYFSVEQLTSLLMYAKIDCSIFDEILLSSEYGMRKDSGKLFQKLLTKFPGILPERMLHIGDNYLSDISLTQQYGIKTFWYSMVPEIYKSFIDMEYCCYGSTLGDISSLRGLAMSTMSECEKFLDNDDGFWFREGAGVLGPIYTLFAEWIINTALKENIKHILPFMREGELFTEVIKNAIQNRNLDLHVTPLYISRRSAALLAEPEISKSTIKQYLQRIGLTISDLFSNFYLKIENTEFSNIKDLTINECKKTGAFSYIEEFFLQDSILILINHNISEQSKLLSEYACSIIGSEDAITVDLHCAGTIQKGLNGALRFNNKNNRLLHLIMIGKKENAKVRLNGIEIRDWLGFNGEGYETISKGAHCTVPVEVMTSASTGCTLYYEKKNDIVVPVLESYMITEQERGAKQSLWNGIYCFQFFLFDFMKFWPSRMNNLIQEKCGVLVIINRLLAFPLYIEAIKIGSLSFDDSHASSKLLSSVIAKDDLLLISSIDAEGIVEYPLNMLSHVSWPYGVVEIKYPNYYWFQYLKIKYLQLDIPRYQARIINLLFSSKKNLGRIALYGLGKIGRRILQAMWEIGICIQVIVDKSILYHNTYIYGVEVISPEQSVGLVDTYIISSPYYANEICNDIKELYVKKEQPNLIFFS